MNKLQLKALELFDEGYNICPAQLSYIGKNKKIESFPKWKDLTNNPLTEIQIENYFKDGSKFNTIAVITGKTSGITIIDIDTNNQGKLKANPHDFPSTYVVDTPSGGVHLYYKYSENIKQGQNIILKEGEVDVRNDGGVVFVYGIWNGEETYKSRNTLPLADAPDYAFVSQSPKGTFKNTVLDDVLYVSMHPELHNRNITLFNYFLTELQQIPKTDEFPKVLETTLKELSNINTAESESAVRATFNSVKKLILKDRKDKDTKDIAREAHQLSKAQVQAYFQRIEEFFIRENDVYALYKQGENDTIYKYNGKGVYKLCSKTEVKSHIALFLKEKNLYQYNKDNFHNEVYNRLVTYLTSLKDRYFTEVSNVINVKNGYFDIKTKELTPHTKDIFSISQLNLLYNPEAKTMPLFQSYLDIVGQESEGLKRMLQELAGYILDDGNKRHAVHFLYGETGNNGKSVFWKILVELLGGDNVSFLKLDSFKASGDFSLEFLVDKKLNISDETHRSYVDSPLYTDISAEGSLFINPKGKKGYMHKVKSNFIIVGNFYPKFKDATGMQRRLLILPFKHKVTKEEEILQLESRIAESELPAIFNWAVRGYDKIEKNNGFYLSEQSKIETQEFEELVNPVKDYVVNGCQLDKSLFCKLQDLYGVTDYKAETGYNKFIKDSGKKPLDFKNFKQDLRVLIEGGKLPEYVKYNVPKTVDGKTQRVVVGIGLLKDEEEDFNF